MRSIRVAFLRHAGVLLHVLCCKPQRIVRPPPFFLMGRKQLSEKIEEGGGIIFLVDSKRGVSDNALTHIGSKRGRFILRLLENEDKVIN